MPDTRESWKMFNQISSTYDRINRILSMGMDRKWRRFAAQNLPPRKNLRILDLATGTADQMIALFEHGASIQRAVGIDLAPRQHPQVSHLQVQRSAVRRIGVRIEERIAGDNHIADYGHPPAVIRRGGIGQSAIGIEFAAVGNTEITSAGN